MVPAATRLVSPSPFDSFSFLSYNGIPLWRKASSVRHGASSRVYRHWCRSTGKTLPRLQHTCPFRPNVVFVSFLWKVRLLSKWVANACLLFLCDVVWCLSASFESTYSDWQHYSTRELLSMYSLSASASEQMSREIRPIVLRGTLFQVSACHCNLVKILETVVPTDVQAVRTEYRPVIWSTNSRCINRV